MATALPADGVIKPNIIYSITVTASTQYKMHVSSDTENCKVTVAKAEGLGSSDILAQGYITNKDFIYSVPSGVTTVYVKAEANSSAQLKVTNATYTAPVPVDIMLFPATLETGKSYYTNEASFSQMATVFSVSADEPVTIKVYNGNPSAEDIAVYTKGSLLTSVSIVQGSFIVPPNTGSMWIEVIGNPDTKVTLNITAATGLPYTVPAKGQAVTANGAVSYAPQADGIYQVEVFAKATAGCEVTFPATFQAGVANGSTNMVASTKVTGVKYAKGYLSVAKSSTASTFVTQIGRAHV